MMDSPCPPHASPATGGGRRRLVAPPALLEVRVAGAGVRRAERDELRAVGACLDPAHRLLRDADRVPLLQVDDLVVELHPCRAADEDEDLLLLVVRMPPGDPEVRRKALVADPRVLELERDAAHPELDVRRKPEALRLVFDLSEVDLRVHGHVLLSSQGDATVTACYSPSGMKELLL